MSQPGGLRRPALASVLVLALQGAGAAISPAAAQGDPAELASAFCSTRLAGDDEGVRALLMPSLLAAIMEAEDRNLAAMEAAPGDKPPFGDGIPYQSFPDLPDACVVGEPVPLRDGFRIPVVISFVGAPTAGWTDALVVVGDGGGYRIDDIVFRGSPDAREPPTLRSLLRDAFDN